MSDRFERVEVKSQAEWEQWLAENHHQTESIWLVTYKKRPGAPHVTWTEIVETAICFGWIDSRIAKLDEQRSMLLVSPRKAASAWSRVNKEIVAKLEAEDRLRPAGRAKIEVAKRNGSWTKLDEVENLVVPPDLATALAELDDAAANFEAFPRSAKRAILEWISNAKTPLTRQRRVTETAQLAQQNIRANQPQSRK